MNPLNVKFVKSITRVKERPLPLLPEIAVVGRSNVGKSSLINTLFNQKRLAKISSTPGKTRLINYFRVDDRLYFVDLPGYGYARVSKEEVSGWQKMIETYLSKNDALKIIILLIDSRTGITELDKKMMTWLGYYKIRFILVFTKKDKLSNNQFANNQRKMKEIIGDLPSLGFSSKTKEGRKELLNVLLEIPGIGAN